MPGKMRRAVVSGMSSVEQMTAEIMNLIDDFREGGIEISGEIMGIPFKGTKLRVKLAESEEEQCVSI